VFGERHKQIRLTDKDTLTVANKQMSSIVALFSEEIRDNAIIKVSSKGKSEEFTKFPVRVYSFSTIDDNVEIKLKQYTSFTIDIWIIPVTSCYTNSYILTSKSVINLHLNANKNKLDVCLFSPLSNLETSQRYLVEYGFIRGKGNITAFNNDMEKDSVCVSNNCKLNVTGNNAFHYISDSSEGFYFKRVSTTEDIFRRCLISRSLPLSSSNSAFGKTFPLIGERPVLKCYSELWDFDSFYESSFFSVIAQLLFFVIIPIVLLLSVILTIFVPFMKSVRTPKQAEDNSMYPIHDNENLLVETFDDDELF
jgi:hypothetical protein